MEAVNYQYHWPRSMSSTLAWQLSDLVCSDNPLHTLTSETEWEWDCLKLLIKPHSVIRIWTFLHIDNAWGLHKCFSYLCISFITPVSPRPTFYRAWGMHQSSASLHTKVQNNITGMIQSVDLTFVYSLHMIGEEPTTGTTCSLPPLAEQPDTDNYTHIL